MYEVTRYGPVVRLRMSRSFLNRPMQGVHAFWIDGLLIDSGCQRTVPDLAAALQAEGLRVEQLVNTHSHEDHISGNAWLHSRIGVTPRAHPLVLERLATPLTWREMHLYRFRVISPRLHSVRVEEEPLRLIDSMRQLAALPVRH